MEEEKRKIKEREHKQLIMDIGKTKRELLEEVGYKGDLRHQLFDAS